MTKPFSFLYFPSSLLEVRAGLSLRVLPGLGEAGAGHSSGPAGSAGGARHQGGAGGQGAAEQDHRARSRKTMETKRLLHLIFIFFFKVTELYRVIILLLAFGRGVAGRPLDHGLSPVCSVQTVGGGGASGSGDGRRSTTASRRRGRRGQVGQQTVVAQCDTSTESHHR